MGIDFARVALCRKCFAIMDTDFSFSAVKQKSLSMFILKQVRDMRNSGLIRFCLWSPMDFSVGN